MSVGANNENFKKKLSNWSTLEIGLTVGMIGITLVLVGQLELSALGIDFSAVIRSIGTFIISAAFLGILYEAHTKHQFFLEAHKLALGTENVALSGICDFERNSKKVDFSSDILNAKVIWTFFSYSSRFIDDYRTELNTALERGAQINMMFLKDDSNTLKLMKNLGWNDDSMKASFRKISDFSDSHEGNSLKIVYIEALPKYSAVIIDDKAHFIFNTVSLERQDVPCLVAKKGQSLFKFLETDIKNTFEKFGGE